MPEPLDNASNSFPLKLKILDRTPSSQNMRGQTAHNRPSSCNSLGEKGDMLYLKTSTLGVCSNSHFKCQASHDTFSALWSRSVLLRGWGVMDTFITYVWVCIYELCLLRKTVVVIAWLEIRSLAELFIESCILVHIYSVISPTWCMDCSLVPRLSQHKAMLTYLKQSQTSQCQTIPYHFSQSINPFSWCNLKSKTCCIC